MKHKGKVIALLAVVLCLGVFAGLHSTSGAALLDNGADMDAEDDGGTVIQDENVPMADAPSPDSEDPFAQFTEDQRTAMNEVLRLVNEAREEAGLSALELDPLLCQAAQVRAAECVTSFSHTRPNGEKYRTAITEAGLNPSYSGENAATGHTSPQQVVDRWLKSQGHRENILNERFAKLGVGLVPNTQGRYKGFTWVQLFMS